MSEISNTGFWASATAHNHHINSEPLGQWLAEYLKDKKEEVIYDFGCGLGYYLSVLKNNGFKYLTGFEGDPAVKKVFDNIITQDLTKPFKVPAKGTCIFLEVAEHIPAEFEQAALDNIIGACESKLIMSWAVRGQAGFGHVNCLNNDEVIDKMAVRGFNYLEADSAAARSINLDTAPWFRHTIMVFEKVKSE